MKITGTAIAFCALISTAHTYCASHTVFSGSGSIAGDITPTVNAFQGALGGLNPNAPTSFTDGRREINWDAAPEASSSPNAFPGNFFNGTVPGRARGIEFATPGTGFQVSANAGGPIQFENINPSYPQIFEPFSQQKIFAPIGSTITDVQFFLPGRPTTPALTDGFGVVFSDVDTTASLAFFDANGILLDTVNVPAATGNQTFSFLGVAYDSPVVSRVRIISGNTPLGPNDATGVDVVAMDDFIFGEPTGLPDTANTLSLLGTGLAALGVFRRIRVRRS